MKHLIVLILVSLCGFAPAEATFKIDEQKLLNFKKILFEQLVIHNVPKDGRYDRELASAIVTIQRENKKPETGKLTEYIWNLVMKKGAPKGWNWGAIGIGNMRGGGVPIHHVDSANSRLSAMIDVTKQCNGQCSQRLTFTDYGGAKQAQKWVSAWGCQNDRGGQVVLSAYATGDNYIELALKAARARGYDLIKDCTQIVNIAADGAHRK